MKIHFHLNHFRCPQARIYSFLTQRSHHFVIPTSKSRRYSSSFTDSETSHDELFAHTTGRWLCNEEINRSLRYKSFNVGALEEIACRSLNAQRCVGWKKIGEGSYNKVFVLEFDDGRKAALRIPMPIVPNVQMTTASEVATMEYVRDRFVDRIHVPKPPKVFAWDGSPTCAAGTPYILLEYVEGVSLLSRWYKIQGEEAAEPIRSMLIMERALLTEPFSRHGSLYFAEDVSEELNSFPLYSSEEHASGYAPLAEKYRIGPTVFREWWRDCYENVEGSRGPWPDMQSIIRSAVQLQLQAIEDGVALQNPYIRSTASDIPEIRRLLGYCIAIADYIIPSDIKHSTRPALNHPDISLTNFIVAPEGNAEIRGVIDWQSASVLPFCSQGGLPSTIGYNEAIIKIPSDPDEDIPWPEDFDGMSPEGQEFVRVHHRLATRKRWYSKLISMAHPEREIMLDLPHLVPLADLVNLIIRSVADGPRELREVLLDVKVLWEVIVSLAGHDQGGLGHVPCPVEFSPEEIEAIRRERMGRGIYEKNKEHLFLEIGCTPDGWVENDMYEEAKEKMEIRRREWNDEEMGGPFPLYEGAWWCNLS